MSIEDKLFFVGIMVILISELDSKTVTSALLELTQSLSSNFNAFEELSTAPARIYEPNDGTSTPLEATASKLTSQMNNQAECVPPIKNYENRNLVKILSPEIFSQTDPMLYILDQTIKTDNIFITSLQSTVNTLLRDGKFSQCYVPYAKALSSLLRRWLHLCKASRCIDLIQERFSSKGTDFSFLPWTVRSLMSPGILQLYSPEILSDPTPPLRIFYKLFNMSKSDIKKLESQLQKFVEQALQLNIIPFAKNYYIWYAEGVWKFIQNESDIDVLKRDMNVIQSMAISDQSSLPAA